MRGLARLFFIGALLAWVLLCAAWYAVTGLIAALVSWPGLVLVGLLAVVAARAATDPVRLQRERK